MTPAAYAQAPTPPPNRPLYNFRTGNVHFGEQHAGLFGGTGTSAVITSLGLPTARVTSTMDAVGALAGRHQGRIAAS